MTTHKLVINNKAVEVYFSERQFFQAFMMRYFQIHLTHTLYMLLTFWSDATLNKIELDISAVKTSD